jgi:hypothetical protein
MELKRFISVFVISMFVFFAACGKSPYSMSDKSSESQEYTPNVATGEGNDMQKKTATNQTQTKQSDGKNDEKIENKIIKTATISLEVDNYKDTKAKVAELSKKFGGYISQENENTSSYRLTNTYIIRIQKEKFDDLVKDLLEIAKTVESKVITSDDVTEEYIDVAARLKNKKEAEKQYVELLKRANTVDEIIHVNEQLRIIREEIEAKEGRLKYINDRVSLSTINLTIYQSLEIDYGFFSKIIKAVQSGWQGLLGFVIGIFYIWPFLIIIAVCWYLIRHHYKNKKAKKIKN